MKNDYNEWMTWDKAKDALLCGACSLVIWIFGEMRSDFRHMTQAVEGLSIKMENISVDQINQLNDLKDHELRIRDLEKHGCHG